MARCSRSSGRTAPGKTTTIHLEGRSEHRKRDPDNFQNFEDFMGTGGAKRWLLNRGESVLQEAYFLFGNLDVFVVAA